MSDKSNFTIILNTDFSKYEFIQWKVHVTGWSEKSLVSNIKTDGV